MGEIGRPSQYKEEYNEQVYKLCLLGATDKEMADFFNVCERTINYWKENHPEFLQSIKRGKIEADANVGQSLYQRATGYSHPEIKLFQTTDKVTGETVIIEHEVIKHYPPDPTSIIYWSKNRRPQDWRDKQEIDHSVTSETVINIKRKEVE